MGTKKKVFAQPNSLPSIWLKLLFLHPHIQNWLLSVVDLNVIDLNVQHNWQK